jgi:hypothetical protein
VVDKKTALKKDFEVFSKGVQRLEELRSELESLNARGHDSEVLSIRSKLKNVSDIPVIERELKTLRRKISGKYKPKKRKNNVDAKIKNLKKELDKKTAACKKQPRYGMAVHKLESEVDSLKRELGRHNAEEKRKKEILKRIDPSVDFVSSEVFDMSLNEIKAELSTRIKSKEANIQRELRDDLAAREDSFKGKYASLEKKYHDIYENKVESQLKKEVQKKFDKLLKQHLKTRKTELTRNELSELRRAAQKEFDLRKEELGKKLRRDLSEAKVDMRKHSEEEILLHKHSLHQKFEQDLGDSLKRLKEEQARKEAAVRAVMEEEKKAEIHRVLAEKTAELKKQLRTDYEIKLKNELKKKTEELEDKNEHFEEEIKRKARVLFS